MITIALYVIGVVFAAGVAHDRAARLKKDVNGVGARVRVIESEGGDRHRRVCMALLAIATDDQKKLLVQLLGEQP